MTKIDRKTVGKLIPFAPIVVGIMLTAWAALVDHDSIAYYNEAWIPGGTVMAGEFTTVDEMPVQISNLRK